MSLTDLKALGRTAVIMVLEANEFKKQEKVVVRLIV
jgi:hypothetical protein